MTIQLLILLVAGVVAIVVGGTLFAKGLSEQTAASGPDIATGICGLAVGTGILYFAMTLAA